MGDASVGVRGEGSPSGGGNIFDELEAIGGLFTTEDGYGYCKGKKGSGYSNKKQ